MCTTCIAKSTSFSCAISATSTCSAISASTAKIGVGGQVTIFKQIPTTVCKPVSSYKSFENHYELEPGKNKGEEVYLTTFIPDVVVIHFKSFLRFEKRFENYSFGFFTANHVKIVFNEKYDMEFTTENGHVGYYSSEEDEEAKPINLDFTFNYKKAIILVTLEGKIIIKKLPNERIDLRYKAISFSNDKNSSCNMVSLPPPVKHAD